MSKRIAWGAAFTVIPIVIALVGLCLSNLILSTGVLVISFILTIVNLYVVYLNVRKNISVSIFTNLLALFVLSFTLYMMTTPLDFVTGTLTNLSKSSLLSALNLYCVADVALIGSIWLFRKINVSKIKKQEISFEKKFNSSRKVAIFLIVLGFILMIYSQMQTGGLSTFGITNRLKAISESLQTSGTYLWVPWQAILEVGLFLLAFTVNNKKDRRRFLLFLGMLTVFFFFGFGSRSTILLVCFPAVALLIDRGIVHINKKWTVVISVFIILTVSPLMTNIRDALMSGQSLTSFPASSWAFSSGETGGAFQITAQLAQSNDFFGSYPSYINAILYVIPSNVYTLLFGHAKPPTLEIWYAAKYFYSVYISGGGFGFSPIAQAWMNGGYVVIIIVYALIGFILTKLRMDSTIKYFSLPIIMIFQRDSLSQVANNIIFALVFYWIARLLISMISRPKKVTTIEQHGQLIRVISPSD